MIKNRAVLNSDSINRYDYRFSIGALLDALEQKALEGVPTCLGHDIHRPIGWTRPFGLYFEPGMCRLVGNQMIAENDVEQKYINEAHMVALTKRYHEECTPYLEEFRKIIEIHLSEHAKYLYAGCVCYHDKNIVERVYPKIFERQDKNGLIYLSDLLDKFTYKGHGVFKDKNSDLAIIAHKYFRKSLSIHNNLNYFLIDELIKQSKNTKIKIRIALDRNLIGFAKTYHDSIELEYWRGPKFNDDVSKIKPGVTVYRSNEFQRLYYGISQTEFWWKHEDGQQVLEVEELKEHPSKGIANENYGCRYVHSIFNEQANSFEHFDGAIRMYDTDMMLERIEKDIKSAGKKSVYTKLFRVDGELSIQDWKTLVCHYYQSNPLIHEYFDEARENEPHIIEENNETIIEKLVPYSMKDGDGIRLFVSYHPIQKKEGEEEIVAEKYISGYDTFNTANGEEKFKVIESDVIELKKALKRLGYELELPENISLSCAEDLYWNIPTINHRLNANLENNISQTLQALQMIFEAIVLKGKDEVASFTLSWESNDEKQITVSIMGHCKDILAWLKENTKMPIDKTGFRDWLEKQSTFLNKYPVKKDKPPLFEMVCGDGVLYIRRRVLTPEINFQLEPDEKGRIMIAFTFTRDQFDLGTAYGKGEIDVALGYIHKKKKCSKCNGDYITCEHSRLLDNGISVTITDSEFMNVVWTDRKA